MEFRCKQFALNHSASTMKVGTDSILLASFLNEFFKEEQAAKIHSVLDVGTGCGIIALCCAQIFRQADILGIDTDKNSVDESNDNFRNSPWKERLIAKQISFQDLASEERENFELIVSNPPYFTNSLLSADERKNSARHNHSLPTEDFVLSGEKLSSPASHIAVILPCKEAMDLEKKFSACGLFPVYSVLIYPKPYSEVIRVVIIFSKQGKFSKRQSFFIRNQDNTYSSEYKALTDKFLL